MINHKISRFKKEQMNVIIPWPKDANVGEMLNWLWKVKEIDEHTAGWTLNGVVSIGFYREEDAVAFRLAFGG